MVLTVVAVMTMTLGFAKTHHKPAMASTDRFELTFDMRRLAAKLDLTADQMEAVKAINDNYNNEVAEAATARRFERAAMIDRAVRKDVRSMRYVLNDKQYNTYMQLFGTTLRNQSRR